MGQGSSSPQAPPVSFPDCALLTNVSDPILASHFPMLILLSLHSLGKAQTKGGNQNGQADLLLLS
jgi:hypothetical protein